MARSRIRLSREARFALTRPDPAAQGGNGWGGWPASDRLVPHFRVRVGLVGAPDSQTGYLCNIKLIDQLLQEIALDSLPPEQTLGQPLDAVAHLLFREFARRWPTALQRPNAHAAMPPPVLESLQLEIAPTQTYRIYTEPRMKPDADSMESDPTARPSLTLTRQFEFSAAHRLHCDSLTAEQNRDVFGKCNNPEGHGHNYVVDVSVSGASTDSGKQTLSVAKLDEIVKNRVIDILDHRHLNRDVPHFSNLNPSVENIAEAIFQWLDGHMGDSQLESVRVYETPKTWAERRRVE